MRWIRSSAVALMISSLGIACMNLFAPTAEAAPPGNPWSVDDLIRAETAKGWEVSRDGSRAVWIRTEVRRVEEVEKAVSNLWLSDLANGESFALTRGTDTAAAPLFSPDGHHVAFLSTRTLPKSKASKDAADRQLWVISLRGGEAYPLTQLERSVEAFGWRSASELVFTAEESPSTWERERKEQGDKAVVVDDYQRKPPVRLFRVDLEGEVERLSHNDDWIDELAIAPDGHHAIVRAQQGLSYEFYQQRHPRIFLVDLEDGSFQALLNGSALVPSGIAWQPDSQAFYFTEERTNHPDYRVATVTDLYHYDLAAREAARIDLAWERGLGGDYRPIEGGFLALLADGVRYRPTLYKRTAGGWSHQLLGSEHAQQIEDLAVALDGSRVVYQRSSANTPPQAFSARLEGSKLSAPKQLTKLNPGFEPKSTGRVEVVRWKGAGGDEVEGLLHYPLGWPLDGPLDSASAKSDEKLSPAPLVVDIHGGPASADRDRWDQRWSGPLLLWRQRGAFVLQVNYHGSAGYGLEWVESIRERYYEQEREDILAGVDALIERGLVDGERLGCAGWSNGGILTADLITVTNRFRAASVGAADVEWISDWANVDFGASFDHYYLGGPPWEKLDEYIEKSPFFRLTEVETPTIIFTGTEDRNVPPHQSWSLFRALQYLDKAPVRLVLFPGEPHGLGAIAHQRRKVEEELAFFDHHLFRAAEKPSEALAPGSLVSGLLARAKASRAGDAFGVLDGGRLLPETVAAENLGAEGGAIEEVGRFETTRAQWAAFDPAMQVAPGSENLPVTGISFDRAQEYVRWLADTTGRSFRLPSTSEHKALAGLAEEVQAAGNTLDHWAGFSPNPRDTEALKEALAALEGEAPLLLPVGSRGGAGEPAIFDLDGNAAEWTLGAKGQGRPMGASADRSGDPLSQGATDDSAYIGLRVIVGPPPATKITS